MRSSRAWQEGESPLLPEGVSVSSGREESRETLRRRDAAEVLGVARCPRCRMELIPRQGRRGPCFACRCPDRTRSG